VERYLHYPCALICGILAAGPFFSGKSNYAEHLFADVDFTDLHLAYVALALYVLYDIILLIRFHRAFSNSELITLLIVLCVPNLLAINAAWLFMPVSTVIVIDALVIYIKLWQKRELKLEETEKLMAEKDSELSESRIDVMMSQIQPHFIFNALTSIAALCDIDPKLAKKVTVDFSGYLRMNIDSLKRKENIAFEKELQHIKVYLDIEQIRFQEYLNVEFDIKENDFRLPPLSIQPLVENAVKHGLGNSEKGGTVKISTARVENGYQITVADDGIGFDEREVSEGTHIGIENVRSRLKALCNGTLSISSKKGKGTVVTVFIPENGEKK